MQQACTKTRFMEIR